MKIELSERYHDLLARRDVLGKQLVELDNLRRELSANGADEFVAPTDPRAARIAELTGQAPEPIVEGKRERLVKMADEARALRGAMDMLYAQAQVERSRSEAEIRSGVAPEYARRVRAICDALKTVHTANAALHELTGGLEAAGVSWTGLGVVAPKVIGRPVDPYSPVALFLRDAMDGGFIKSGDIPKELRQ